MQVATSHAPAALFGERLVKLGKLKPVDLERALRAQAEIRQPLGSVLVRLGMLTEQEVAFVLLQMADQLPLPGHQQGIGQLQWLIQ